MINYKDQDLPQPEAPGSLQWERGNRTDDYGDIMKENTHMQRHTFSILKRCGGINLRACASVRVL